ncbi:MAG TPA: hypothetical protein DF774_03280 [Rheinheimera sp.]|nr:hypothetical protein [Rheinheimera sp.]
MPAALYALQFATHFIAETQPYTFLLVAKFPAINFINSFPVNRLAFFCLQRMFKMPFLLFKSSQAVIFFTFM